MARLMVAAPFDPTRPVFVRRSFKFNGRHWLVGAEFDWRHSAVAQNAVRKLYEAGRLRHQLIDDGQPTPMVPVVATTTEQAPNVELDELEGIDEMTTLRDIAKDEGAPLKTSKADQRQAIRDHRQERAVE